MENSGPIGSSLFTLSFVQRTFPLILKSNAFFFYSEQYTKKWQVFLFVPIEYS